MQIRIVVDWRWAMERNKWNGGSNDSSKAEQKEEDKSPPAAKPNPNFWRSTNDNPNQNLWRVNYCTLQMNKLKVRGVENFPNKDHKFQVDEQSKTSVEHQNIVLQDDLTIYISETKPPPFDSSPRNHYPLASAASKGAKHTTKARSAATIRIQQYLESSSY